MSRLPIILEIYDTIIESRNPDGDFLIAFFNILIKTIGILGHFISRINKIPKGSWSEKEFKIKDLSCDSYKI